MDDAEAINVPVQVRTQELEQLQHYVPRIHILLDGMGQDEEAKEMAAINERYVEGVRATYPEGPEFAAYMSMPSDQWWSVVQGLGRFDDTRTYWLRKKLASRLRDRLEQMDS